MLNYLKTGRRAIIELFVLVAIVVVLAFISLFRQYLSFLACPCWISQFALGKIYSKGEQSGELWNVWQQTQPGQSYEMRAGVGGGEIYSWASVVKGSDQEIARWGSPHLGWPIYWAAHASYATDTLNHSYLWQGGYKSTRMTGPQLRKSLEDGWGQRRRKIQREIWGEPTVQWPT